MNVGFVVLKPSIALSRQKQRQGLDDENRICCIGLFIFVFLNLNFLYFYFVLN